MKIIDNLKKPQKLKYRLITLKYDNERPDILEADKLRDLCAWIEANRNPKIWNISIYIKKEITRPDPERR